jgi:acyl carrier protein
MDPVKSHDGTGPSEAILATVRRCIAESLAIAPAEIQLHSRLIDDLGADSLDFVDILFMLDAELGIGEKESELNFMTRLDFSSPQVMKEGHLTGPVVAELETWLPAVAALEDKTQITPAQLFSMITVEAICIVVGRRLAAMQG